MPISSIILIIIGIVAVYFFIKFVVNPLIKIIFGIAVVLALIYALQNFFNIDVSKFLGPLSPYLNLGKWDDGVNELIRSIVNYLVNNSKSILK